MSTKSPLEFVFKCCEFTKAILYSKSWCEMLVLKLSGIQKWLNHIYIFIINSSRVLKTRTILVHKNIVKILKWYHYVKVLNRSDYKQKKYTHKKVDFLTKGWPYVTFNDILWKLWVLILLSCIKSFDTIRFQMKKTSKKKFNFRMLTHVTFNDLY